jgi:hypothetical protein
LALSLPACGGTTEDVDTGEDPGPDAGTPTDTADSDVGACSAEYPVPGMKVVFHDADGQPLGVAETNDAGIASFASCVKGGMVTLVRPSSEVDATRRFFTVQGVNPGDAVRFNQEANVAMAVTPMSLTIQNNLDEVTQGATSYVGTLGACTSQPQALDGSNGGTLMADSLAGCLGDDPSDPQDRRREVRAHVWLGTARRRPTRARLLAHDDHRRAPHRAQLLVLGRADHEWCVDAHGDPAAAIDVSQMLLARPPPGRQ